MCKDKRSICLITTIAPTFNTNPQSPLSNLFMKMTLKLNIHMKDLTFKQGEKVQTKLDPKIGIIIRYPIGSTQSQWIYFNPFLGTSFANLYLLTI